MAMLWPLYVSNQACLRCKVVTCVLCDDPYLDCMTQWDDRTELIWHLMASRHKHLKPYKVLTNDGFCNGMLHLESGIYLEESEPLIGHHQELDRTGVDVICLFADTNGGIHEVLSKLL